LQTLQEAQTKTTDESPRQLGKTITMALHTTHPALSFGQAATRKARSTNHYKNNAKKNINKPVSLPQATSDC
jgi:hypothetical protein